MMVRPNTNKSLFLSKKSKLKGPASHGLALASLTWSFSRVSFIRHQMGANILKWMWSVQSNWTKISFTTSVWKHLNALDLCKHGLARETLHHVLHPIIHFMWMSAHFRERVGIGQLAPDCCLRNTTQVPIGRQDRYQRVHFGTLRPL